MNAVALGEAVLPKAGLKAHVCLPGSASPPACRGPASPPACRGLASDPANGERGTRSRVGAHVCLPGSASPPACRGPASPPACRGPASPPACRGRSSNGNDRQRLALRPPDRPLCATEPARRAHSCKVAPLVGQKKPATYPRRPGRSRTARTIPTVPCPSCQTASRRYAHSHRHPAIKHVPRQSGPLDLRALADGLGWRPPPPNSPDKPPALRYSPGETTEMAIRHPSTHSATSPPARLPCRPPGQHDPSGPISRPRHARRATPHRGLRLRNRPILSARTRTAGLPGSTVSSKPICT
jgi:hypothetical protein